MIAPPKGKIQATVDTVFNRIAQSILERGFDKVVLITERYVSMSDELKEEIGKRGLATPEETLTSIGRFARIRAPQRGLPNWAIEKAREEEPGHS